MDDTAKYLIHARIAADGVVERSDVVGAVFGQTEGLLGDELDLRDLQQSSKVGRIDVEISSENGQSFGTLTIATSLDKAETAVLGASLETIERVGPCRATIEVTSIEDVRAAKRRAVVDRAKELLATAFDETAISSEELVADVRASVQVEEITEYAGLPAGPSVGTSDAIIIVEGRADVLQLLKHGIKNAIGVEGTNVPDAVAELASDRTVTVFVDGDRGGELILRELLQIAAIDYVVFAPAGNSVEDLSRETVHSLLREKIAADRIGDTQNIRETITGLVETSRNDDRPPATASTDQTSNPPDTESTEPPDAESTEQPKAKSAAPTESATEVEVIPTSSTETAPGASSPQPESDIESSVDSAADRSSPATNGSSSTGSAGEPVSEPSAASTDTTGVDEQSAQPTDSQETPTLRTHVREIIDAETGRARLLSKSFEIQAELDLAALIETLETDEAPSAIVLDGELSQALLDVAAQFDVDQIVARSRGEFVKQPVGTRVLTADELREAPDVTV